ncbi:MAG TPA: hypothetical protein VMN82_08305 [Thermoanaerobaculia bacterium]|nr:hypothetical protein [Thermoanaerobaculia bacterium]
MRHRLLIFGLVAAIAAAPACRRLEKEQRDAVQALRARVRPGFRPPADGLLTDGQIEMFLRVRKAAGRRPPSEAAAELGVDPAEFVWVRARLTEALLALDAHQTGEAAYEAYGPALARLRDTRRATRDATSAARLDAEIATLEKERAAIRKNDPGSPASRNAVRLATRRAELERAGP